MKALKTLALVTGWLMNLSLAVFAAESAQDSSTGLPAAYAKHDLIAGSTMSPDKNFAVIYPTLDFSDSPEAKDFLVAPKPFSVLAPLPTDRPYFQNQSHGGLSAEWSKDGAVALITLDSKWGPGDVLAVELAGGKVKRTTNVLEKLRQLLLPQFRGAKPKPESYNDVAEFLFEDEDNSACKLVGTTLVKIDTKATNDPKGMSERPWAVGVKQSGISRRPGSFPKK